MFWDQASHRWTFVAHRLPATAAGRTYQLWLITHDQRTISAGTFDPSPDGGALVRASYELPGNALAAVAVTEEPAGGVSSPTSVPFLVGQLGSAE
jgi:anti-sigma-K factor RskA